VVFGDGFAHYLSYGATDQRTVRELAGVFDGLLVPGTVAAFQREGTGGFVLTLSAASTNTPYVIDPRSPLFQQPLTKPKRSHGSLAEILRSPELVRSSQPLPDEFTDEVIDRMAEGWAEFNQRYQTSSSGKFEKYAKRLNETVQARNAKGPNVVLPPYFIAEDIDDPWWGVSLRLFEATRAAVLNPERCIHVVASSAVFGFQNLVSHSATERVAIWVSALDELTKPAGELAEYARAIRSGAGSGKFLFALYGGFFSVLLQNIGLSGSSHGVGYGEQRDWVELPESGPPPQRYYVPQLHRYMQPDRATQLLFADQRLAICECEECEGVPPIALDYHALMKHSVRCRSMEIDSWSGMTVEDMARRLDHETTEYRQVLHASGLGGIVVDSVERQMRHLDEWQRALTMLA
jgi:hypothetical protein